MATPRCTVESLETRSLYSATTLPCTLVAPAELQRLSGHADEGVTLANGKTFILGAVNEGTRFRNVYLMYNGDGTLDRSFGHNGYAIQSVARSTQLGVAEIPYALPDGSVLIQFANGLRHLTAKGDFDANYGTNGLANAEVFEMHPQLNGTSIAIGSVNDVMKIIHFDRHGKILYTSPSDTNLNFTIYGSTTNALGRWDSGFDGKRLLLKLVVLNADGSSRTEFATGGTLELQPIVDAWQHQHGPWYNSDGDKIATPTLQYSGVTAAHDGGYVIDVGFNAIHTKPTAAQTISDIYTQIAIHVSRTGQVESINSPHDGRSIANFVRADYSVFGGAFHYGSGADQTFAVPNFQGWINNTVRDANGNVFLLGTGAATASPDDDRFTIVRVAAAAQVSGTLFNDRDRDGIYDAGETVNANRAVYLDANHNGKLDAGEDVTYTDARGKYTFSDVAPGSFTVRRVLPSGFKMTTPIATLTLAAGDSRVLDLGSVQMS